MNRSFSAYRESGEKAWFYWFGSLDPNRDRTYFSANDQWIGEPQGAD